MTALRSLSRWLVPLCAGAAVALTALGETQTALPAAFIGAAMLFAGSWGWPFGRIGEWGPISRRVATILILGAWGGVVWSSVARGLGRSGWAHVVGSIIAYWFVTAIIERWAWMSVDSNGGSSRR